MHCYNSCANTNYVVSQPPHGVNARTTNKANNGGINSTAVCCKHFDSLQPQLGGIFKHVQ